MLQKHRSCLRPLFPERRNDCPSDAKQAFGLHSPSDAASKALPRRFLARAQHLQAEQGTAGHRPAFPAQRKLWPSDAASATSAVAVAPAPGINLCGPHTPNTEFPERRTFSLRPLFPERRNDCPSDSKQAFGLHSRATQQAPSALPRRFLAGAQHLQAEQRTAGLCIPRATQALAERRCSGCSCDVLNGIA